MNQSKKMSALFRLAVYIGTPLTMAAAAVVAATGLSLFFGFEKHWIKEIHEWLGITFLLATVLHVYRNFPSFRRHLTSKPYLIALALVVALSVYLALPEGKKMRGGPGRSSNDLIAAGTVTHLAPLLNSSEEALIGKLRAAGLTVNSAEDSPKKIAKQSKRSVGSVIKVLLASN